ncbi:MAG TPA: hypothetical protein VF240_02500 [Pyrinomonadaceae bacterium]
MKKASPMLLLLLAALGLTLAFALSKKSRTSLAAAAGAQEVKTHLAQKKDFLSESGQRVLEVVEASYQTTPDSFDSSSVRAKNLSGKNITALGLVWTVTYEDKTNCQIEQLIDYRLHRDIVADRKVRAFAPDEEKVIPRLTKDTLEEGRGIESVSVEFAFAELEEAGAVGSDPSGLYKQLRDKRAGAEIYKRWVESGYDDTPAQFEAVVGKLSGDELPADKALENDKAVLGALVYKQWMLGVLKDKGAAALQKQLRQSRQPSR